MKREIDIVMPLIRGPKDIELGERRLAFFERARSRHKTEELVMLLRTVQGDEASNPNLYQRGVADMLQYLLGITHKPPLSEQD